MIQPIREQILVKLLESKKVSKKGIIVADSYVKPSDKAIVLSVGNGTSKRPMEYKKDDIVYRIKGAGIEVKEKGETFYLIHSMDILAYERNN